jgi:CheY-like chemotaxis protein
MADVRGHILVVDDNRLNRIKLAHSLGQQGHTTAMAEDGRQALEMLRAQPFDLVMLDILMPEMDGYQVLEQMKGDSVLREVPVIVISAVDEMEWVVRCILVGAEDYFPSLSTRCFSGRGRAPAWKRNASAIKSSSTCGRWIALPPPQPP